LREQRNEKANATTHFKDSNEANVPRLKVIRPPLEGQLGVFGVGDDEPERSIRSEAESKDNLNDGNDSIHEALSLSFLALPDARQVFDRTGPA
jgi:hypothetical protein